MLGRPDCCDREAPSEHEDDARVAEREEDPDAERRPIGVAPELARGVVDRRDVIGIERVPHPERVRKPAQSRARGTAIGVGEPERPTREVKDRDECEEASERAALALGEQFADATHWSVLRASEPRTVPPPRSP